MKPNRLHLAASLGAVFVLGIIAGVAPSPIHRHLEKAFTFDSEYQHGGNHRYAFVSPLLLCGETRFDHVGNDVMLELERQLDSYVDSAKQSGKAGVVGIYFRQLKGGPWLGVDYEHEFAPGSLLKVPLAMAIEKAAESNPSLLAQEVFYESGDTAHLQYFKNVAVTPGKAYTVQGLLEAMLVHSDNNAADLLASVLTDEQLQDAYHTLGVSAPNRTGDYVTNVHYYSSFFRILYNATYLSPDRSEELLKTLAKSTYTQGLVAGVPDTTVVSHKFGERALQNGSAVQLHDCGIIYHPERPYLLCVMTQGQDFAKLSAVIRDISKIVWESVD